MRKIQACAALMLICLAAPAAAFAASPWTEKTGYCEKAHAKFKYGLDNAAFGWLEVFTQTQDDARAGHNAVLGFGKGLFNAAGQTVGGVLHAATAPATFLDIPLPEGGFQFN